MCFFPPVMDCLRGNNGLEAGSNITVPHLFRFHFFSSFILGFKLIVCIYSLTNALIQFDMQRQFSVSLSFNEG